MNIIKRIFNRGEETRIVPMPVDSGGLFMGMGSNIAGVNVSGESALFADAVWACISVISDAFAGLPVHVRDADTGDKQKGHPLTRLLRTEPNPDMTPAACRTAMMSNLLLHGTAFAFIERVGGRPVGLYPLPSSNTYAVRRDGKLVYVTGDQRQVLRPDQVLAIPGLTLDGVVGLSPVKYAAKQIGLSLVASTFAEKAFSGGGNLGGIIETPPLSEDAQQKFVDSWKRNYGGLDNAMKVAALPSGWKFHPNQGTPEKAQLLDTRVHQVRVVARVFKVPLHKIGDLERATFSNIEHQSIEFMENTIAPHAVRWEQELNRKLLTEAERDELTVSFNLDALLRADTKARYEAHNIGVQGGWLTRNEVRRLENLPPIDGGDVPLHPLNMGPNSPTGGGDPAKATPTREAVAVVLEDAAGRLLTKERNAVTRAAKKHANDPEAFNAWAAEFYDEHRSLAARTLTAALAPAARRRRCGRVRRRPLR